MAGSTVSLSRPLHTYLKNNPPAALAYLQLVAIIRDMKSKRKIPKALSIDATITKQGINIRINHESFPIVYPPHIWGRVPQSAKEILRDNFAYSSTIFLPQILNISEIQYNTARPLSQTYLFQNGIYDMTSSAEEDGRSSVDYLKRFFNTRYIFADQKISTPSKIDFSRKKNKKVVIPFSFGKESLLSYALARDLGLDPILVSIIEPSHTHEFAHRKRLIREFEKEHKTRVYTVLNNPGVVTKSGRAWGLSTELGYGLQATEYAMMAIPFAIAFDAYYLTLGNEQSCHDFYIDREGLLNYRSGYDQLREWTSQQGMLLSILSGKKMKVMSLVEPLYEIAETKVLQQKYSSIGRYQMSCFAISEDARARRWCENCYKCAYLYPMFAAFGIDTKRLGFTSSMFDKKRFRHYESLFARQKGKYYYGRSDELMLAFYLAAQAGHTGYTMDRFKKSLMPYVEKNKKRILAEYLGVHDTYNIPEVFKKKIMKIYSQELS